MRYSTLFFTLMLSLLHTAVFSQLQTVPQSNSKAYITHAIYSRQQQIIAQSEYRVSRLSMIDARSKLKITDLAMESPVIGLATDSSGKYIVAATER